MGPIEKEEFDPTRYSAEFVAVERDEHISAILERVGEALRRTPNVVLIIPRGAQAFHTTQDFLALGKLQWTGEVRVAVASPDPTIAGLARVLGFHIVDPPVGHPALAGDPTLDSADQDHDARSSDIEKPTAPLPLGGLPGGGGMPDWVISPAVPSITGTQGNLTTSTWLNMSGDGTPQARTPGLAPPLSASTRSGVPPPRTKPRQTGRLTTATITDTSLPLMPPGDTTDSGSLQAPLEEAKARRAIIEGRAYRNGRRWRYNGQVKSVRWGRVFVALAVLLLLSLVAASTYAYVYLPEGTVYVTPSSKDITALNVTIAITFPSAQGQGASGALTSQANSQSNTPSLSAPPIAATLIEAQLSADSGPRPSTGTRQVKVGKAQGTMHFANRTSEAKLVPIGAKFRATNGVTVQTTQAGNVPATNFLNGAVGQLDVPIVATIDGPDGNIAAGQIAGTFVNALDFTNTEMQGGSLQTIKTVAQSDIDALNADLSAKLDEQLRGAIADNVGPNQTLITQTITLSDKKFTLDHKAGDVAEAVSGKTTGVARAYVYDKSKMDDSVALAVTNWVTTSYSSAVGPNLDPNSIGYDSLAMLQPVDVNSGQVIYTAKAHVRIGFSLTTDLARQIRDLVKGQNVEQARNLITQRYSEYVNVQSVLVRSKVLWFNIDKLPSDPSRIVVQLGAAGDGTDGRQQAATAPMADGR